ncbi:hypothetical protein OESDEN_00879 [Oesophagostomum dentatum]|uniref:NADH-ubiquinone oxidoreductase subunit B14.7 n=1 Tax=Oesophagostomum dentatum TaxID=61180 RepID=A0A0B1TSS9_OESDE|nr:hypothetical protein OESDEN_00879 [Oesophagostomum dentatum]
MSHDEEPPLVATYRTQRPPWIGLWSTREYKGRPDWWKEAGVQDNVVRSGKLRMIRHRYKEEDPEFFDPKVPDGTSLTGPLGLDSQYHHDTTIKADQPGSLKDFQEKVWKGSHQYKAIAEKFDISKEHPGFDVNPTLNDLMNTSKWHLGRSAWFPNSWYHYGPRFFEKPLNQASIEKGLACAKYTAFLMLPYTMLEIRTTASVPVEKFSPKTYMQRYFKLMPKPAMVAFTWGFALSTASAIRNKDDVHNHLYASAAVGAVVSAMRSNLASGISIGLLTYVLGAFWQYARVSEDGIMGLVVQPRSAGIWGGPLMWRAFQWGDKKIPDERY